MNKIGNYIEDKVEEFRLSGKKPAWIGLTLEVSNKLSDEYRAKMRDGDSGKYDRIVKFIGLDVVLIDEATAPKDGVHIQELPRG